MYRNRSFQFLIYCLLKAVLPAVNMEAQQLTHGMSCCPLRGDSATVCHTWHKYQEILRFSGKYCTCLCTLTKFDPSVLIDEFVKITNTPGTKTYRTSWTTKDSDAEHIILNSMRALNMESRWYALNTRVVKNDIYLRVPPWYHGLWHGFIKSVPSICNQEVTHCFTLAAVTIPL